MGLFVFYESIGYAFIVNASTIKAELREKVQKYRFFILYNKLNFYKYMHDTQIFNQKA